MIYFYIDDNGVLQSTSDAAPVEFHYEFEQKPTYMNIMVVRDIDGEVHSEYQGWTSIRDLRKAIKKVG